MHALQLNVVYVECTCSVKQKNKKASDSSFARVQNFFCWSFEWVGPSKFAFDLPGCNLQRNARSNNPEIVSCRVWAIIAGRRLFRAMLISPNAKPSNAMSTIRCGPS
jgi:hypothetical protein